MLRDHDLHNAISGASKAVPDAFHCNPYADPTSEEYRRYRRTELALEAIERFSPRIDDPKFWVDRIIGGWPCYGYDSVNTLEAVARAYAAFDEVIRAYNFEMPRLNGRPRGRRFCQ